MSPYNIYPRVQRLQKHRQCRADSLKAAATSSRVWLVEDAQPDPWRAVYMQQGGSGSCKSFQTPLAFAANATSVIGAMLHAALGVLALAQVRIYLKSVLVTRTLHHMALQGLQGAGPGPHARDCKYLTSTSPRRSRSRARSAACSLDMCHVRTHMEMRVVTVHAGHTAMQCGR